MTNTYLTGNPLGSNSPKDLSDNTSNFDEWTNSTAPSAYDRFRRRRMTWAGAEYEWQQFMQNFGFEPIPLVYVDGTPLAVARETQLIQRTGSLYKVKLPVFGGFPITLTGTWATDAPRLVEVGDAALRAALAAPTGGSLVGVEGYADLQANLDALAAGEFVTPEKYGAVGDGVADDTLAVQQAVTFAQDNGSFLLLRKWYRCTSTILQTKRLRVLGVGKHNCGIIYTGAAEAWLATVPFAAAGFTNNGWTWDHFTIKPAVDGSGTYGLRIKLQAAGGGSVSFFADGRVSNMYLGDFGLEGLYLDNSVGNVDGFFTSQFEYNSITNGLRGVNLGDSLTVAHNKIFGRLCGLNISGVAGARQLILNDNNVTTSGGAVALQGVEEPTLIDNQLEHPGYLSGYTGTFGAFVLLFNCYKPLVTGNTINPDNGAASAPSNPGLVATSIALTGTTVDAVIDQNDINKGAIDHINVNNSAVARTTIGEFNTYYGTGVPTVTNGGTNTRFPTVRNDVAYAATIANGVTTSQGVSVPGARVGMFVQAEYSAGSLGVDIRGFVTAPNVVQVILENKTGASVALAGGNLTVKVSA